MLRGMASDPTTQLFDAMQAGDLELVDTLLERAPSLASTRRDDGTSALMWACDLRRPELVARLRPLSGALDLHELAALGEVAGLEARVGQATPTGLDRPSRGFAPLHLAAFHDRGAAVAWLALAGADVNAAPAGGLRPLHSAVAGRSLEATALLLGLGADPDAAQDGGHTALHAAALCGDLALVGQLLEHGAQPSPRDEAGRTPAERARERDHEAIAELLERAAPRPRPEGPRHALLPARPWLAPLRVEAAFPLSPAEALALWSEPAAWERTFSAEARIELRPGGPFEVLFERDAEPGEQGSEDCRLLASTPSLLLFDWNAPPVMPALRKLRTLVAVRSEATEQGCRVELIHGALGAGAGWPEHRAYFLRAWQLVMQRMALVG